MAKWRLKSFLLARHHDNKYMFSVADEITLEGVDAPYGENTAKTDGTSLEESSPTKGQSPELRTHPIRASGDGSRV